MRVTIVLDDELVARAQEYTGITDISLLVDRALRALVAREESRRSEQSGGKRFGSHPDED